MSDAVLTALLHAALDATAARHGWIVAARDGAYRVVAAAGGPAPALQVGRTVPASAPVAVAIATGQPAARRLRAEDVAAAGAGGFDGVPDALLTVPCGEAGAIELAGTRGEVFTIDDIEIVSLLAEVVAVALADAGDDPAVPSPEELGAELARLRDTDRSRYAFVARAVSALLGVS
jgi:hypothetical protein